MTLGCLIYQMHFVALYDDAYLMHTIKIDRIRHLLDVIRVVFKGLQFNFTFKNFC